MRSQLHDTGTLTAQSPELHEIDDDTLTVTHSGKGSDWKKRG